MIIKTIKAEQLKGEEKHKQLVDKRSQIQIKWSVGDSTTLS